MSEHEPDQPTSALLEAALSYASLGWRVIPLHGIVDGKCTCSGKGRCKPGKHPRMDGGYKRGTSAPEQIRKWWSDWPDANVGVCTGLRSGIVVIDVDGDKGASSLEALEAEHGPLPATTTAVTGRGRHIYLRIPQGRSIPSRNGLRPGIEMKSSGGYVVAPPSMHASGRRYHWDGDPPESLDDTPVAPDWLCQVANQRKARSARRSGGDAGDREFTSGPGLIPDGRRNMTLMSIAGSLRRLGLSEEAIFAALLVENEGRCRPPLDRDEVAEIARNVAKYAPAPDKARIPFNAVVTDPQVKSLSLRPQVVFAYCLDLAWWDGRLNSRDYNGCLRVPGRGPMSQQYIADDFVLDKGAISKAMKALMAAGLMEEVDIGNETYLRVVDYGNWRDGTRFAGRNTPWERSN